MTKLTARVDEETYNSVMYQLRYGQQTALLQQVMTCLAKVIATDGIAPIVLFIAGQGPLTLDPREETQTDGPNG
jgi:hypothetical protein